MRCPICGDELTRSKKDSRYGLCYTCRKKFKWVDNEPFDKFDDFVDDYDTPPRRSVTSLRHNTSRVREHNYAKPNHNKKAQKKKSGCFTKVLISFCIITFVSIFTPFLVGIVKLGNTVPDEQLVNTKDNRKTSTKKKNNYMTKASWAELGNYMFAVEIDDFDGDVFSSGKYHFYPDLVILNDNKKTPIVWDVYISDKEYKNETELKEHEPSAVIGGLEKDEAELTLSPGQYIYINYNEVLGEPTGILQIEKIENL